MHCYMWLRIAQAFRYTFRKCFHIIVRPGNANMTIDVMDDAGMGSNLIEFTFNERRL